MIHLRAKSSQYSASEISAVCAHFQLAVPPKGNELAVPPKGNERRDDNTENGDQNKRINNV